jgi:fermentation-respiration switch protein FrsA (DUF1100 family)
MYIVLYVISGLIAAYLLLSLILFLVIFSKPKILDFTKINLIPYPEEIKKGLNLLINMPYEEVIIPSFDKIKLVGRLYEIKNPRSLIILVHGYSSSGIQDFGSVFNLYQNFGYNILIIAQRAHGVSGGHFCTFGIKESRDLLEWTTWATHKFPFLDIKFSGVSLGSTTILMAQKYMPVQVSAIVADCGFISPALIFKHQAKTFYHLPSWLFMGLLKFWALLFLHIKISQSTLSSLNTKQVPILFVHGRADNFVPFWMGEKMYNTYQGKKDFIFVEGARHGCSYFKDPQGVIEKITNFFNAIDHPLK